MIIKRTALAVLAAIAASAPAGADVTISTAATQNMTCSGGVCVPTATDAVLNVVRLPGFDRTPPRAFNPFLSPSIRGYTKRSSQASRHPLRNALKSSLPRGRPGLRLSDPERSIYNKDGPYRRPVSFMGCLFSLHKRCRGLECALDRSSLLPSARPPSRH